MKIEESLPIASKYISSCDWSDFRFSWEKAFVNAVFANIAYSHIADFELENTDNVNLIPSSTYADSMKAYIESQTRVDIKELFNEFDAEIDNFVIEDRLGIASVVRINELLFISLRGTEFFNISDWRYNLYARKFSPLFTYDNRIKFHKGFYEAVLAFKERLEREIIDRYPDSIYIYISGHSLGGAMAAILYGLWGMGIHHMHSSWGSYRNMVGKGVQGAYTFGMPRYANSYATTFFPNPFHILNSRDLIPNVPPESLGYSNCTNNYPLDKSLSMKVKYYGRFRYFKKIGSLILFKKTEHHSIENYVARINHQIKAAKN
ncbi:lipase family protein [Marinobacter adhaerens]|jgi:predicted lipase|uniref:lipase family protein n=1 Tax=Marinobacter adhaerens TaxID=1033846 RepID=UPI003BAD7998